MKAIHFLSSATVISAAFVDDESRLRRFLQYQSPNSGGNGGGGDVVPPSSGDEVICDLASGETPCYDEIGLRILACAPPHGTCPCFSGEMQCTSSRFGQYCDTACCEWETQERCHAVDPHDDRYYDVWCANVSEGGCPCPVGQTKCGVYEVDGGHSGYCTELCCDNDKDEKGQSLQQTCYDEYYEPSSCAYIADGGCPCPEGQVKCGGNGLDWAGYCTKACCGPDEEACFDEVGGNKSCMKKSEGGCRFAEESQERWRSRVVSTILAGGTGGQVSYYGNIRERMDELLSRVVTTENVVPSEELRNAIKHLEEEEAALFHAVRVGRRKKMVAGEEQEPVSFF